MTTIYTKRMDGCCSRLRAFSHISMKRIGPHPLGDKGQQKEPGRDDQNCVSMSVMTRVQYTGAIVDTSTTDSKCAHLILSIGEDQSFSLDGHHHSVSFLPLTNDVALSSPAYCTDSCMGVFLELLRIPIRQLWTFSFIRVSFIAATFSRRFSR